MKYLYVNAFIRKSIYKGKNLKKNIFWKRCNDSFTAFAGGNVCSSTLLYLSVFVEAFSSTLFFLPLLVDLVELTYSFET